MSYTQAQLDALRAAAASGTARVTINGRTVEYRSLAEIRSLIAEIERSLGSTPTPFAYPEFHRTPQT